MNPNPVLRKLGLSDNDRAVIIHTDDIGMCQASVEAFVDLTYAGLISSGASMVPCPWFLAVANFCKRNPKVDMGVHATLTSEWDFYRWGPISTREPSSGLMDWQGYFPHTSEEAQANASSEFATRELVAQVECAVAAGIQPTHMDTHMGTVAHPKFMVGYLQTALNYRLPAMMFRMDEAGWRSMGLDADTAAYAAQTVRDLEGKGYPLLDQMEMMQLEDPSNRFERTCQALNNLSAGVTHFAIHPSKDTPELRAITPDWRCRVADYQTFMSAEMGVFLKNSGLHIIGYRDLQNLISS